jgi:hypothetical protein
VSTPELYDELTYTMVNGDTYVREVPAGQGRNQLETIGVSDAWIQTGVNTRIQANKIVSVQLVENAHDEVPVMR